MTRAARLVLALAVAGAAVGSAGAEPMVLARQYTRCTTCHFSPTGGALLTPYGRSLSRQELSTTGRSAGAEPKGREHEFLWGALGDAPGPVSLGFDVRPGHLRVDFPGSSFVRDFLMNADLQAAYRGHGFTAYGEVGRQPRADGAEIGSYQYWLQRDFGQGLAVRAGRFLPAYGVRLADHTSFTRRGLGLGEYDQVLGVELSRSTDRHLLQLSLGPGHADDSSGGESRRAFTATGRFQSDLGPRSALVFSGMYRGDSDVEPRTAMGGAAFGFSPIPRLSIWTEGDAQVQRGADGAAYVLLNETALEVFRGLWLKLSPQLRTDYGSASVRQVRLAVEADLLPRTHWNIDLSYYRDHDRISDLTTKTLLLQLHLYL